MWNSPGKEAAHSGAGDAKYNLCQFGGSLKLGLRAVHSSEIERLLISGNCAAAVSSAESLQMLEEEAREVLESSYLDSGLCHHHGLFAPRLVRFQYFILR